MIGRDSSTARYALAVSVLTAGLAVAGYFARPTAASAAPVPVTIVTPSERIAVHSSAPDVGALLEEAHVRLGAHDSVDPGLAAAVPPHGIVRVTRVLVWQRNERQPIAHKTIRRLDFSLDTGASRVIAQGRTGERDVTVRFTQVNGGAIKRTVIAARVARAPKTRIVAEGAGRYDALAAIAGRGVDKTYEIASRAMHMIATAYTADCAGCSGITAIGRPAGHGIVAVDPSVIPLGTKLFIPGYGFAIAGDTGGAIRGSRIDLGFNSLDDAIRFGRRDIIVYRVK